MDLSMHHYHLLYTIQYLYDWSIMRTKSLNEYQKVLTSTHVILDQAAKY